MRIRTGYSFKTAVGHLPEVLSRLQEIGMQTAPISDRASTFGYNRWTKLATKAGLRPIYGVELGVTTNVGLRPPTVDFWTFFAKDNLRPLHDIIGIATNAHERTPMLTYKQALEAEGVIKIAGERLLIEPLMAVNGGTPPLNDFYFGLSPAVPKALAVAAKAAGLPFIATSCNYYPRQDDLEFYRVAIGKKLASTQTYPQHILSHEEWVETITRLRLADDETLLECMVNLNRASDACQAKLRKATLLVPEKETTLRAMCEAGAKRTGTDLTDSVYAERLDRELKLIADKNFEDYFYIIADLVAYAKQHMIVGPARGSSCGSLVCYLLDITTIDPIPHGLFFERFIDINRHDLPDIDIDFSDSLRKLVFEYAEEKYGKEHVARLGTVGMFKARSVMRQVGVQMNIPRWELDKVLDNMGDGTLLDALQNTEAGKAMVKQWPGVLIAARLDGHPSNASQHAAGIVITQSPIKDYVALHGHSVMCDKRDAEEFDLLKIDALGLTQLSVFERTLELIGKDPRSRWLETLPLDDPAAFNVLNNGHFSGIFQFNGPALQSLAKQIRITSLDDIVAITALARPGPLQAGAAHAWVHRKAGIEAVSYPHPALEPYLKPTLGVLIFQEQLLQIGREIGDLTWPEVTELRKAISKSMGEEELNKFGDRWKQGAAAKGIPEHVYNDFWHGMCLHGKYSFNKAHSVAYAVVSYYCCWLKAYYPTEFAAATLDPEPLALRQIYILRELEKEGVGYKPVEQDHSTETWNIAQRDDGSKYLVGPLSLIKGIGPASVKLILKSRAEGIPLKPGLLKKLREAKTDIDTLYPITDHLRKHYPDFPEGDLTGPPLKFHEDTKVTNVIDCQCGLPGQVVIIGAVTKITVKNENDPAQRAKRGGWELKRDTKSLGLFFMDDTDEIYAKINREMFEKWGAEIVERGRVGKALYAVRGKIPRGFRMITIDMIRYIGDLDDD